MLIVHVHARKVSSREMKKKKNIAQGSGHPYGASFDHF
jgi:hypothetical protein